MFRANKHGGRLTKLRFVCSACGVNCIDEHGFAQHLLSEKHLANEEKRAAMPVGPSRFFYDDISAQFELAFLNVLSVEYLDRIALAHDVYHSAFADDRPMKELKRTCWESLGEFIISMRDRGRINAATRTAKGWEIELHSASMGDDGSLPGTELPKRTAPAPRKWDEASGSSSNGKTKRASETDWAQQAAERAAAEGSDATTAAAQPTELTKDSETKIGFGVSAAKRKKLQPVAGAFQAATAREEDDDRAAWAAPGLIVKVMRGPTSEWRKRKALVSRKRCVDGTFEVFVSPLDEPDLHAWIASKDLETVIPPVGRPLRLLAGAHKGEMATLRRIDEANFCVEVELEGDGRLLKGIAYEDVCKVQV